MASCAIPPYGMFLANSEIGASALAELASRILSRNPKAMNFVCHDRKTLGDMDESMRSLTDKRSVISGVFERPLSKSRLENTLFGNDAVRIKYPECGMGKDALADLIQQKLT